MSARRDLGPPWALAGERINEVGIATDGGIHRKVALMYQAGCLDWLGEPASPAYAHRYDVHRGVVLRENLAELTARHAVAEGEKRAALAQEMADLGAMIGQADRVDAFVRGIA